jgi:hypothetical protein
MSAAQPMTPLLAWLVLALASAVKVWRLSALVRRHLGSPPASSERFRQSLERIWARPWSPTP